MRRPGFTLIEIVIVLAIVMILSAILLPVFNSVRGKARQTTCASNLRQIGLGVVMYVQDNDDLYPLGGDPTDINTAAWQNGSSAAFAADAKALRPLPTVLASYVKEPELWHCPADSGFDFTNTNPPFPLNARPSSFAAFGSSYYYRTEITLRRKRDLTAFEPDPPHTSHGPVDINMLYDGKGNWHGEGKDDMTPEEWNKGRYNVLMADGHIANMTAAQFDKARSLRMTSPQVSAPN